MASEHTPGRLVAANGGERLYDDAGWELASCLHVCHPAEVGRANARRLAAAWNAADEAGLSTTALEAGAVAKLLAAAKYTAAQWPALRNMLHKAEIDAARRPEAVGLLGAINALAAALALAEGRP